MLESWSHEHTDAVVQRIGGRHVLDALQLHPLHVARLAAIIDMNSFVVEGFYNEDRGKGYFPEAGLLNHSCCPNAEYDILDDDAFRISDFNDAFVAAREKMHREERGGEAAAASAAAAAGGAADGSAPPQEDVDTQEAMVRRQAQSQSTRGKAVAFYDEAEAEAGGAPSEAGYLFCCRAARDIAAGEEVLISYVPPEWRYENRQHVLYDRYRFACRCEKCSPTIDSASKLLPRMMILVTLVFVLLSVWQYALRQAAMQGQANAAAGHVFPQKHFWGITNEIPHVDPVNEHPNAEQVVPADIKVSPSASRVHGQ